MRIMMMTIVKGIFSTTLLLTALSCREISQQTQVVETEQPFTAYEKPLNPFVGDQSLDFFLQEENQWYTYDQGNHIIWPNFRIYALRTQSRYYKVQFINYYNENSEPGNYTIRLQPEGQPMQEMRFVAKGCGNVYTNPDYNNCVNDPQRNVFTYLNIETGKASQMTAFESQNDPNWHIAFLGTEIKLNSGDDGPGDVRIARLYSYDAYYPNGTVSFQRLAEESFGEKGMRFFELEFNFRSAAYVLPEGIDRVIFEDDWFKKEGKFFAAKSENWWFVKNNEGTYSKFNVAEIVEVENSEHIDTTLKILTSSSDGAQSFDVSFSSSQRLIKTCLDLDAKEVVDCSDNKADIIFSGLNRRNRRRWLFNVNVGAVGPLSKQEVNTFSASNF